MNIFQPCQRNQQGIALMTILIIMAVCVTLAVTVARLSVREIQRKTQLSQQQMAKMYAFAAEDFAKIILKRALRELNADTLEPPWAAQIKTVPFENGVIHANLMGDDGKFNLNNLMSLEGHDASVHRRLFRELLVMLEIDPDIMQAIIEWISPFSSDAQTSDNDYEQQKIPYRMAHQAFQDIAELTQVKGVTPEIFQKLLPVVTVLPVGSKININLAPLPLMQVIFGRQYQATLRREYTSLSVLTAQYPIQIQGMTEAQFTVKSLYFLLTLEIVLEQHKTYLSTQLMRRSENDIRILQRSFANPLKLSQLRFSN